jgi:hypothetical protein
MGGSPEELEQPISGDELRAIKRYLAAREDNYLGHRDPKHKAPYARVAGHRFEWLWR